MQRTTKATQVHEIIHRSGVACSLGIGICNTVAQWKTWPGNRVIRAEVHSDGTCLCHKAACGTTPDAATHCMIASFPADFQGVVATARFRLNHYWFDGDLYCLKETKYSDLNNMQKIKCTWLRGYSQSYGPWLACDIRDISKRYSYS